MSELEPIAPDIAELLEAERRVDDEPAARQERVLGRLLATTAAIGGDTAPAPNPAGALTRFAQTKAAIAIGAALVGTTVGGVVGYRLGEQSTRPRAVDIAPSAVVSTPPPVVSAPPEIPQAPSGAPSVTAAPPRPSSTVASRPRDAARGEDDLALELSLVQMARAALTRGNFAAALDATDQHARAFPAGNLAEERESIAIQALVGAGRDDDARARATRFHAKYPRSPLRPAVDAAIRAIP